MAKRNKQPEKSIGINISVDEYEVDDNEGGLRFKHKLSPSVPLDGMEERVEEMAQKLKKLKKNDIFSGIFDNFE